MNYVPYSRYHLMKLELLAILITGAIATDMYCDGKYSKIMKKWTKYYRIGMVLFAGFAAYSLIKRKPRETQSLLVSAGDLFAHMPVDKQSKALLVDMFPGPSVKERADESRILKSGATKAAGMSVPSSKRSVSDAKKKYVAASQEWKCNKCQALLTATYEVDHVLDLQYGGSNEVSNLVALCRNCHGEKTMSRHL